MKNENKTKMSAVVKVIDACIDENDIDASREKLDALKATISDAAKMLTSENPIVGQWLSDTLLPHLHKAESKLVSPEEKKVLKLRGIVDDETLDELLAKVRQ